MIKQRICQTMDRGSAHFSTADGPQRHMEDLLGVGSELNPSHLDCGSTHQDRCEDVILTQKDLQQSLLSMCQGQYICHG